MPNAEDDDRPSGAGGYVLEHEVVVSATRDHDRAYGQQDQVEHGAILASAVQRINAGWILASDSGNFTLQYNQLGPSARLMVRRGRSAAFEHGVKADHSLGEQRSD